MSVSYWQDQSNSADLSKSQSKNDRTLEFDVVIIGAGLAGFSTAYWLLKENAGLKIAIVEKHTTGHGASGRNAGFITCGSVEHFNRLVINHGEQSAHKIWQFSEKNLNLLKNEIISPSQSLLDFEENGSFSLASEDNEFNELKKSKQTMDKLGIHAEILNKTEIKNRLGATGFVGGIKYCGDASIHPFKLLNEMKRVVLDNPKCSLYENHEVFSIDPIKDKKLIKTNNAYFLSQLVIIATNGYSPILSSYFKDKITPTRGQILTTSPVARFMEGPCYANFVLDYFRQLPTGELIIGGFRQLQKETELGYSDETTDLIQNSLELFLRKHLPKFKDAKITHRWSGVMGFSTDGLPMIGSLPTDNQVYFLGGFTAHGLGLTFHSAKCLVDLMFDRKIPDFISGKRF